jgi:hypothetical protein
MGATMTRIIIYLALAIGIHIALGITVAWACSDHVWPYATAPALPYGQPSVKCNTVQGNGGNVFIYCR